MSEAFDCRLLDNLRVEIMRALLNEEGRREIWKYDIVERRQALAEALYDQNYDNIDHACENRDKPYALVGPAIDDTYFGTVAELVSVCYWLCHGVLSAYAITPSETYSNQQQFLREGGYFMPLRNALTGVEPQHPSPESQ